MNTHSKQSVVLRVMAAAATVMMASACGGEGAGSSGEVVLDMAAGSPSDSGQGRAYARWMEELESRSGGEFKISQFWNGELLAENEVKSGLQDGRVQLGTFSYAYSPNEFPLTQMVEIPDLGNNLGAQATAMNTLYDRNDEFRAEWEEGAGIKVLSFVPIAPPITGAKEPITTIDWFRGKTVRASGAVTRAVEAIGGNPVPITAADSYEAMQRGTIDAYGGMILDYLPSNGLYEVGPHVMDSGLGHYAITTWGMSMETWESLTPEQQELLEELNSEFPLWVVESTTEVEDEACNVVLENGGTASMLPESETERWLEAIGGDALEVWYEKASAAGASDPRAMYAEMVGYYEDAKNGEFSGYQSGMERCSARS